MDAFVVKATTPWCVCSKEMNPFIYVLCIIFLPDCLPAAHHDPVKALEATLVEKSGQLMDCDALGLIDFKQALQEVCVLVFVLCYGVLCVIVTFNYSRAFCWPHGNWTALSSLPDVKVASLEAVSVCEVSQN
jgi:hypothetical protein